MTIDEGWESIDRCTSKREVNEVIKVLNTKRSRLVAAMQKHFATKDKPLNFTFQEVYKGYNVLIDDKVVIRIQETRHGFYETHAELSNKLCNKGIGVRAYEYAIGQMLAMGRQIRSATRRSEMATRLWQSERLRRRFKIQKLGKRYAVVGVKNACHCPSSTV